MYAIKLATPEGGVDTVRKGKGVPAKVLKRNAAFEDYVRMNRSPFESAVTFRGMRRSGHDTVVTESRKRMLSAMNDKVFMISEHEARPLGHFRNQG